MLRVLRLIKSFHKLSEIFDTLFYVLPSVGPVGALFLLVLFIFTLIGNQLYPYLKSQATVNGVDLSFRTFSSTLVSLVRVASAEQWFLLVNDISR